MVLAYQRVDCVSHAKLLLKLKAYGIRNVEFEWFSDYIFNRKLLFNYNNTLLFNYNNTLLYVAGNSIEIIESHLSDDLNLLAE